MEHGHHIQMIISCGGITPPKFHKQNEELHKQ